MEKYTRMQYLYTMADVVCAFFCSELLQFWIQSVGFPVEVIDDK